MLINLEGWSLWYFGLIIQKNRWKALFFWSIHNDIQENLCKTATQKWQNKNQNNSWQLYDDQKYRRMLPLEDFAMLLTFIKQ